MDHELSSEHLGPNLGMTSLVIGLIALAMFFMPVLGIPLGLFALFFGVIGLGTALLAKGVSLRWSLGGIVVSCLALAVNVLIANAPNGYLPSRNAPKQWQPVADKPFIVPPASRTE